MCIPSFGPGTPWPTQGILFTVDELPTGSHSYEMKRSIESCLSYTILCFTKAPVDWISRKTIVFLGIVLFEINFMVNKSQGGRWFSIPGKTKK